eukprot:c25676_g1_i1.p1 GENE.c25676_g1_i1~~c25676_g1_i1.p1  ORF type:complete len:211 (-),score=79.63 c25676_g1_i1:20-559(-)
MKTLKRTKPTKQDMNKKATEDEIVNKARQLIKTSKTSYPKYKREFEKIVFESSSRMTSSAAKTVFDPTTEKPICIKLSIPILSIPKNFHSEEFEGIVMHEVAHWIAGIDAKHNSYWRSICADLKGIESCHHTLQTEQNIEQDEEEENDSHRKKKRSKTINSQKSNEPTFQSIISQIIRF